jgi:hypothetical protein
MSNVGLWTVNILTEGVDQILAPFPLECNDLSAGTSDVGVDVECFPKMVNTSRARHSTDIQKDADIRLQYWAERVEEPTMRVDFLLIFLFETEDNLHWHHTTLCAFDLHGWGDRD